MSQQQQDSHFGESEAFTSPRSDPFAVGPDPLSDSDEEAVSTLGRTRGKRAQQERSRVDNSAGSQLLNSEYKDADDEQEQVRRAVMLDPEDEEGDEPPQSLMYESVRSSRQENGLGISHEESNPPSDILDPHQQDARRIGNRSSTDTIIDQTRRTTRDSSSPFLPSASDLQDQSEEKEVDGKKGSDGDLASSSTPQPYERNKSRFDSAGQSNETPFRKNDHHPYIAQPSPVRGRPSNQTQSGGTTSTSLSTFRSNSASPPPDLLESGSISSDLESMELGATGRRSLRKPGTASRVVEKPLLPPPVTYEIPFTGSTRGAEPGPSRDRRYHPIPIEPQMDENEMSETEREEDRPDARDNINSIRDLESGRLDQSRSERKRKSRRKHNRDKETRGSRLEERGSSVGSQTKSKSGRKRWTDAVKGLSERERTLWIWVNVVDLDGYLSEVYDYYVGKGLYCIALRRLLNLFTSGFVIIFSTFLFSCIDYSKFPSDGHGILSEVIVPHCSSRWSIPHIVLTWVLGVVFVWRILVFALGIRKLSEMKAFYEHLLNIPNSDIQSIPWSEVVRRIGEIRDDNPTTSLKDPDGQDVAETGDHIKLDAHDVANRILRQENYLIALFNKDLLDLHVRIPLPRQAAGLLPGQLVTHDSEEDRFYLCFERNSLTKALEWNLRFCLLGYLFDERGHVRKEFVRGRNREQSIAKLRNRFMFMGVLNAIFSPFIVLYLVMYSFFRYFEEYHKNPSSIGSRQYTPYARWKFREFNELPHLFDRRLDESYEPAKQYIDQFPKEITALSMRFVSFIAGAFAAVLLLLSVIDPVFLHFEITQDRTVLFYLGLFTSVLAVARGAIPPNTRAFSPEELLTEVVAHTHYLPDEWSDQMHSRNVHVEFSKLFEMKLANFLQELLSVILTPFILCFSLPRSASAIIDFFREFTIHVDGIGYVCSFAVFDFKRQGKVPDTLPNEDNVQKRLLDKSNKMEKSFLHFKITNPAWQPADPSASLFLSKVAQDDRTRSVGNGKSVNFGNTSRSPAAPSQGPIVEEQRLKDRSNLYERALQRSIMLRSGDKSALYSPNTANRGVGKLPGQSRILPTMNETGVIEEEEEGWETKMMKGKASESLGDLEGSREAYRRDDNGMLHLLQDVMRQ